MLIVFPFESAIFRMTCPASFSTTATSASEYAISCTMRSPSSSRFSASIVLASSEKYAPLPPASKICSGFMSFSVPSCPTATSTGTSGVFSHGISSPSRSVFVTALSSNASIYPFEIRYRLKMMCSSKPLFTVPCANRSLFQTVHSGYAAFAA